MDLKINEKDLSIKITIIVHFFHIHYLTHISTLTWDEPHAIITSIGKKI